MQNQNFFRTNPETIDKMRAKVGKDWPQVVYADQLQNDTSINQPRDTKQVRNLNHRETKKRIKSPAINIMLQMRSYKL
jgi:hypothetical protein